MRDTIQPIQKLDPSITENKSVHSNLTIKNINTLAETTKENKHQPNRKKKLRKSGKSK